MRSDEEDPRTARPDDRGARDAAGRNTRPLDAREHDTVDRVAGPAAGASGALTGGAVGTLILGPIGTAIGAAAGALGGWWAGSAIKETVPYSEEDDRHYREHYARSGRVGRAWENVSPAYHLGHLAARNPDYRGRSFEEIEPDLRRIWNDDLRASHGDWSSIRDYVRAAYARGPGERELRRSGVGTGATAALPEEPVGTEPPDLDMGGTASHHRAEFSDPGPRDAHPEAGFFDRAIGARSPSEGDPAEGRDDGMDQLIDRGGFKPRDDDPHKDAQRRNK